MQVAILGGGLIGASWSTLFLAHNHHVTVADPNPGAPAYCRTFAHKAWPHLAELITTLPQTPPLDRLHFTTDIATACQQAQFVQECGPDRIATKQEMITQAERTLPTQALIASSSSSLMASDIQAQARHPDRILVAHPMNPPHLVPLVELVAGTQTTPPTMDQAEALYTSLGRIPIRVQKERPGHLANRLTSALYREAVHIVAEGIATVTDVDRAIAYGPGMRWGLMGPHLIYHLGGGPGGYRHYLDHLGPTQEARWADLGTPRLTPDIIETLVAQLQEELSTLDTDDLETSRDRALVALAKLKQSLPF